MEEGMSNKYIAQGHAISKWQSCDKMYNWVFEFSLFLLDHSALHQKVSLFILFI